MGLTQCVTLSDKMLSQCLALTLLVLGVTADLGDFELSESESAGDPRLFFANFTSSLITNLENELTPKRRRKRRRLCRNIPQPELNPRPLPTKQWIMEKAEDLKVAALDTTFSSTNQQSYSTIR